MTVTGWNAEDPSADLVQAAQELAHLGAFFWHVESNRVTWSDELYRLYGLDPGTPLTRETYISHVHPEHREQVADAVRRCLESQTPYDHDYRIVQPSGRILWVHGRGRPVSEGDEVVALYGTCHDITDRKAAEEALAEAHAEIEKTKLARQQIAEINNNIVHWVVQASQSLDDRDMPGVNRALAETLRHASRIITELEEGLPHAR